MLQVKVGRTCEMKNETSVRKDKKGNLIIHEDSFQRLKSIKCNLMFYLNYILSMSILSKRILIWDVYWWLNLNNVKSYRSFRIKYGLKLRPRM